MDVDKLIENKSKTNFKVILSVLVIVIVVVLTCYFLIDSYFDYFFNDKIVKMDKAEATECFIDYVFPDTSTLNVKIIGGKRCINALNEGIYIDFYADQNSIDKIILFHDSCKIDGKFIRPFCHSSTISEDKLKNNFGLKFISFACISG
jgi:hypothetical protein